MKTRMYKIAIFLISLIGFAPFVYAIEPGTSSKPGASAWSMVKKEPVAAMPARPNADLEVRVFTNTVTFRGSGEYVNYTISVRNKGVVPVFRVMVDAPELLIMMDREVNILKPGEYAIYAATHVITPEDVQSGRFINQPTAFGYYQDGNPLAFFGNKVTISLIRER